MKNGAIIANYFICKPGTQLSSGSRTRTEVEVSERVVVRRWKRNFRSFDHFKLHEAKKLPAQCKNVNGIL